MTPDPNQPQRAALPQGNLDREESQLWRWALGFMILLAFALAALLWERLEAIPYQLRALPIGVLILSILFAVYAYGRRREVSELKGVLRGLQEHVGAAPSEEQLDQLSQVIMRSQRNFKELIDSFDDPACAVALDGTIRTVNKRVTELTGLSYTDLVGRKIYDLIEEPTRDEAERGLGRFLDKKRWAGTAQLRLKGSARLLYFDCVINGIVKGGEVVGASVLGRDVTEQREKELRFTELFETLQEGVYFSTPDGQLLDANPALVRMLGYEEKTELLSVEPTLLNFESGQAGLGHALEDRGGIRTREVRLKRKDGIRQFFWIRLAPSGTPREKSFAIRARWSTLPTNGRWSDNRGGRRIPPEALESFPDLILVVDLEERYTFTSSRVRDLLGYEPEEMQGKKISDLEDHSPELACSTMLWFRVSRSLDPRSMRLSDRDGTWRTMRASGSQLVDSESRITA